MEEVPVLEDCSRRRKGEPACHLRYCYHSLRRRQLCGPLAQHGLCDHPLVHRGSTAWKEFVAADGCMGDVQPQMDGNSHLLVARSRDGFQMNCAGNDPLALEGGPEGYFGGPDHPGEHEFPHLQFSWRGQPRPPIHETASLLMAADHREAALPREEEEEVQKARR